MSEHSESFTFDGWADIQFMGHRRLIGKVRTDQIGGTAIFVVETPNDTDGFDTEIYAASALYALRPISEQIARAIAKRINPAPVNPYELPDDWRKAIQSVEQEKRDRARAIEAGEDQPIADHDQRYGHARANEDAFERDLEDVEF